MERSVAHTDINFITEFVEALKYTCNGRMKYNPECFGKTGQPWNAEDVKYLVDWFDITGSEEMAFALERTQDSLMSEVRVLRKEGIMIKSKKWVRNKKSKGGK